MSSPTGYLAEQLISQNAKISALQAQRVAYIAGTVSSLNIAASTFGADIPQPDGTTMTVTGIRSSPHFLPAVGNVVTLALSGAQIVYMPFGVAANSIDTPQLSPAVTGSISTASSNASSAQTSAAAAQTAATGAQTTANAAQAAVGTKITTYYAGIAPSSGMTTGDLWVNTGLNNTLYRWSGSSWIQVQDQQIQTALTNAGTAQATADGKIQTFLRSTAPTNPTDHIGVGDFWLDQSNGNKLMRWSGSAWVSVQDASIATALANATSAQTAASTKVLVFAQPTTPTAQEPGDMWFNTGNGNQLSIWGPTPTVTRINYALNPSFEADASGTRTTISSWTNYANGSTGTVTRSIVTSGGVQSGTKAAKIVMASPGITAGIGAGLQQSYVSVPGDVWRFSCSVQLAVTDTNKVPYMLVEWLNSSNGVISSVNNSVSGTTTGSQTLTVTTGAAPSLTASVRVTIFRRSNGSGSSGTNTDLVIDAVLAEKNRDSAAATTYFDGDNPSSTDSKWDNPTAAPNSTTTYWAPGVSGVNAWQVQQLRTAAIATQSILGNDCIAYGSITAPLLEALLVLTGTVVAGDPNADHAALMTDGLHLFRTVTGEGLQEVGDFAIGSVGTYLNFINSSGQQVAQIDEGGNADVTSINCDTDPVFQGQALQGDILPALPRGVVSRGWYTGATDVTGLSTSYYGLFDIPYTMNANDDRMLMFDGSIHVSHPSVDTELVIGVFYTTNGTAPTTSSTKLFAMSGGVMSTASTSSPKTFSFLLRSSDELGSIPDGSNVRFLLATHSVNSGSTYTLTTDTFLNYLAITDVGPGVDNLATINTNSGTTGTQTKSYTSANSPSGHWSYKGSGVLRTDTTDVVQGLDPSGFNGDGQGGWNFSIPNISGTVTKAVLYIYNNWAYYNSGAKAKIRLVTSANTFSPTVLQTTFIPTQTYPKPGPITLVLPSGWLASFKSKTSIGIYLGPGGSDETYYMRADGPSAKLTLYYTQ